jgi:hypothetical protein
MRGPDHFSRASASKVVCGESGSTPTLQNTASLALPGAARFRGIPWRGSRKTTRRPGQSRTNGRGLGYPSCRTSAPRTTTRCAGCGLGRRRCARAWPGGSHRQRSGARVGAGSRRGGGPAQGANRRASRRASSRPGGGLEPPRCPPLRAGPRHGACCPGRLPRRGTGAGRKVAAPPLAAPTLRRRLEPKVARAAERGGLPQTRPRSRTEVRFPAGPTHAIAQKTVSFET